MNNPTYAVATSLGASFNGPWVDMEGLYGIGWQVKWTGAAGSAVGAFGFDITCDQDPSRPALGATRLTLVAAMLVAGAAPNSNDSNFFFDFTSGVAGGFRPNAKWMRLVYTRTSGTGTVDVGVSGVSR